VTRRFRPMVVRVDGIVYELHRHTEGHPTIYDRGPTGKAPMRPVSDEAVIDRIAAFLVEERAQRRKDQN
jgi:hypothetical protein